MATATAVNGPHAGTNVTLALTDPDSNEVVPHASPKFGGDFMLDSQGDQELIFGRPRGRGGGASLSVLAIGTAYSSVTPCDQNSAPATCPGPGYPANYLATANLTTGALSKVALSGAPLQPKGQVFVRF